MTRALDEPWLSRTRADRGQYQINELVRQSRERVGERQRKGASARLCENRFFAFGSIRARLNQPSPPPPAAEVYRSYEYHLYVCFSVCTRKNQIPLFAVIYKERSHASTSACAAPVASLLCRDAAWNVDDHEARFRWCRPRQQRAKRATTRTAPSAAMSNTHKLIAASATIKDIQPPFSNACSRAPLQMLHGYLFGGNPPV